MSRAMCGCAAIAAALVLVAGCSGDEGGTAAPSPATTSDSDHASTTQSAAPGDTSEPPATAEPTIVTNPVDRVGCEVKVTGDVESTFTGKDDTNAFASDHYLSEEEIDSILELTTAVTEPTVPGEESDLTMPPREAGTALVTAWFLLNCQDSDTTFGVYSDAMSTAGDLPFGTGTYDVVAPGAADDPDALRAFVVFGADPDAGVWTVDEGGKLTISRFDEHGAAGTFHVPMTEAFATTGTTGRHVIVEGTFDVTCKSGALCTS